MSQISNPHNIQSGEIIGIETEASFGEFYTHGASKRSWDPKEICDELFKYVARDRALWKKSFSTDTSPERAWLRTGGTVGPDIGNLEFSTPECKRIRDVVLAQEWTKHYLVRELALSGIDPMVGLCGTTRHPITNESIGNHESCLVTPQVFDKIMAADPIWCAFLCSRIVIGGAGYQQASNLPFYISQRATAIQSLISMNTGDTSNIHVAQRGLINTRREPHSSVGDRLHIICGDGNALPSALFLKLWSTRMVLWGIQHNLFDELAAKLRYDPANCVPNDLHPIASKTGGWELRCAETPIAAVDFLRQLFDCVKNGGRGCFSEEDLFGFEMLDRVLPLLSKLQGVNAQGRVSVDDMENLAQLSPYLDWANLFYKLKVLEHAEGGISTDEIQAACVEYYSFDPNINLFLDDEKFASMQGLVSKDAVEQKNFSHLFHTRADFRNSVMNAAKEANVRVDSSWDTLTLRGVRNTDTAHELNLPDPRNDYFDEPFLAARLGTSEKPTYRAVADDLIQRLSIASKEATKSGSMASSYSPKKSRLPRRI